MRNLVLLSVVFLLTVATFQVQGQTDPDCDSFGRIHKIYYMSCFPRDTGETTDDERIQRAIVSIPSGKLIFNEGLYVVDETVELRAFLIIEGTSTNTLDNKTSLANSSHIQMIGKTAIFEIGAEDYDVAIRDIGLSATTRDGTIGILGIGAYPDAALHFEFSNIRFTNFEYGIKVQATDTGRNFQFDNVKVDHCVFEGNDTGIYVDSYNSGWQISSIEFNMLSGQKGVHMKRVTYSEINSMIGNGQPPPTQADTFILIEEHANISINNCVAEGVDYDLKVVGPGITGLNYPIYLYNNTFQAQVDVSYATVYATANQYGLEYFGSPPIPQTPQPIARNLSQIYSYGEKFCFEGSANCTVSGEPVGWTFNTGASMVSSSNYFKNFWSRRSEFVAVVKIETDDGFNPLSSPLLSVIAPTYGGKALIKLGQSNYNYSISRSGTTGWLRFDGNQSDPYKGFQFNGQVRLPSYTASTLPTIIQDENGNENGSMVFCSDCEPDTVPCSGGSTGALAITIDSRWTCK